jgi:hypothetical protein
MFYEDEDSFRESAGHEIDGIWYPRVTKIMEIKAKPALYRFYGEVANYNAGQAIAQKSAEEGTKIHETVESLLLDENPVIAPDIKPAIDAFLKFFERNDIKTRPDYIERRIVNYDHRYSGTLDALASIDGKFGVLDIKTSQAIYRDYNLQTSAYVAALQDEFQNLEARWILRIDQIKHCVKCGATLREKGGRQKIRLPKGARKDCEHEWSQLEGEIELKELPFWEKDFEAFLGAKKLWEWENEYLLKKIGYLK